MRQKTNDKIHRKDAKNAEKNYNVGEKTKGKRQKTRISCPKDRSGG